jgi:centrin-1
VLRALGFDPSNDEIISLIRELGKNITKLEEYRIDFQEFLDIMIAKMVDEILRERKRLRFRY